jgi:hypothetical protein
MSLQLIAELRMSNVYQLPAALADCFAMQISDTILRHYIVNVAP